MVWMIFYLYCVFILTYELPLSCLISSCVFSIPPTEIPLAFVVVVLNPFSFCFSVKLLTSPLSQEKLTGLSILGCRFFPFITLNMDFPGSSVVKNLLAEAGDKG